MGKEEGTKYDIKKESNKRGKREQKCCSVDFLEEKKNEKTCVVLPPTLGYVDPI